MDFIVLFKSADNPTADWQYSSTIYDLKADEGERAIEEGSSQGEGTYLALAIDTKAVEKAASNKLTLSDPPEPPEPVADPT